MISSVVALLHPRVDVVAALDFPFVDVRCVAEGAKFVRDPKGPIAVTARVADVDVRHDHGPSGASPRNALLGRARARRHTVRVSDPACGRGHRAATAQEKVVTFTMAAWHRGVPRAQW